MRHSISWTDLAGEKVGVWGLGTEGLVNLRKLRSLGVEPVLVDDRPERVAGELVLRSSDDGLDALGGCSVVVKTPGISRYSDEVSGLEADGIPVVGGLGLWLAETDLDRVVCVTGTKGKSTTTTIAAHVARNLGLDVFAGGNLGQPPYDPDAPADVDLFIVETSSYQAIDVPRSPVVVAVTSLHPDHLPWHRGERNYFRDKLSLCSQPGARLTVASSTSALLVERAAELGPEVQWIGADTWSRSWAEPLGLLGEHNLVNANIARSCLVGAGVAGAEDDELARRAAGGFRGLESRLDIVGTVGGVEFVDDSLSTNVLSTLAAVASFPERRVALIAGGLDRDIDYRSLATALAARTSPTTVFTVYATGPKIQAAVEQHGGPALRAEPCGDLDTAVRQAQLFAEPDGVVLLSPAAASFDAFDDYRHRGRVFRAIVADLADS